MLRNFPHGCNFRARQHGWNCSPDEGRRAVNHCNEYSGTPRKNSVVIISNLGITPRAFLALLHGRECAKVQGVHGVNSKFGIRAVGITGEENAPPVAKEFLERAFRHPAFPGYGNSLGGGERAGQFRHHGKLHIGQRVLADDALHPRRRYPEILRKTDSPLDSRRLYRLFLFCPARPVGEGKKKAEPHGIDFKFARNRRERVAPLGVAPLRGFVLP